MCPWAVSCGCELQLRAHGFLVRFDFSTTLAGIAPHAQAPASSPRQRTSSLGRPSVHDFTSQSPRDAPASPSRSRAVPQVPGVAPRRATLGDARAPHRPWVVGGESQLRATTAPPSSLMTALYGSHLSARSPARPLPALHAYRGVATSPSPDILHTKKKLNNVAAVVQLSFA